MRAALTVLRCLFVVGLAWSAIAAESSPLDAQIANADYAGAAKALAAVKDDALAWKAEAASLVAAAWPKALELEAVRVKKGLRVGDIMAKHPMAEATITALDTTGCTVSRDGTSGKVSWRSISPAARLALMKQVFDKPTDEQRRAMLGLCALHDLKSDAEALLKDLPLSDSALERHFMPATAAGAAGKTATGAKPPADEAFPHHFDTTVKPDADAGVPITAVVKDGLAEVAGVKVGDRVLAIDGWAVDDATEMLLLRSWLPLERDHETWTVLRGVERVELGLDVMGAHPVGVNIGGKNRCDERTVDALCKALGLTPSPFDRLVLGPFPPRAAHPLIALAGARPATVPRLKALVTAYIDLCEDRVPTYVAPSEPLPDPFLMRLERFYAAIAALGSAEPTPGRLGVDRWFVAAYYPYPSLPPAELGDLHLTDDDLMRYLAEQAKNQPEVSNEAVRFAYHYMADITPQSRGAQPYLGYIRAALVSPYEMGGWPYRSWMVSDNPSGCDQIIAELKQLIEAGGPDLPLYQFALVGPLENRGDFAGAAEAVAQVYAVSPYLGERAADVLRGWPSWLRRTDQLADIATKLAAAKIPTLAHPGIYRLCERVCPEMLELAHDGPRHFDLPRAYRNSAVRVATALRGAGAARNPTLYDYDAIGERLYRACPDPLTTAPWQNKDDTAIMARSLLRIEQLLDKPQPVIDDLAAIAYAVLDRHELAVRWMNTTISLIEGLNQENADRRANGQNARRDIPLELYQRHQKAIEARVPMVGITIKDFTEGTATDPDGGAAKGPLVDGKRTGRWIVTYADGHDEQGWFANDKRQGPWVVHHPGGAVAADGVYRDGHRVGWWRFLRPDGSLDCEGCFLGAADGDGDRVGPWTWRHPSGALKSEGFFLKGKRAGVWRTWHANGRLESEGEYADDQEVGVWLWFDDKGKASAGPPGESPAKGDF